MAAEPPGSAAAVSVTDMLRDHERRLRDIERDWAQLLGMGKLLRLTFGASLMGVALMVIQVLRS